MKDFTATIHNPERAAEWQAILGTTTIYIRSPIPEFAQLPGHPNALIYYLDLDLLTEDQWTRLVIHLAYKFGLTAEDADAMLEKHGLPILANDCKVTIHNPQRWWL
jgi:hypothetical protein